MSRFLNGTATWISQGGLTSLSIAVAIVVVGYGVYFYLDQYRPFGAEDSTVRSLRAAVETNPTDITGRVRLASAYLDSGQLEAAEAEFKEMVRAYPGLGAAKTGLGLAYFRQGKYPQALEQFEGVIEKQQGAKYSHFSADLNNAYFFTGVIFMKTGRLEEAEQRLREAVATNKADGDARMYLGWVVCQLGRCQEGLSETNLATLFAPDEPDAHYYQGLVLEKMGKNGDASTEFSLALKYQPDFPEAAQALRRVKGG